jgi:hypothetical protein
MLSPSQSFRIPLARREESFSISKAPHHPPSTPPSQGGERDRSFATSFHRAQPKHASRNRPSSSVNTNFSPAQGHSPEVTPASGCPAVPGYCPAKNSCSTAAVPPGQPHARSAQAHDCAVADSAEPAMKDGSSGFRAPLLRIHREGEWLVGDRPFGGGTRGPSSRPQTPIPFSPRSS